MGRNTKLSPGLQKKICDGLRSGHFMKYAAPLAGVTARSAQGWLALGREEKRRIARGEAPDPAKAIYLDFLIATEEASSHTVD